MRIMLQTALMCGLVTITLAFICGLLSVPVDRALAGAALWLACEAHIRLGGSK